MSCPRLSLFSALFGQKGSTTSPGLLKGIWKVTMQSECFLFAYYVPAPPPTPSMY